MTNLRIREAAERYRVYFYEIAEVLNLYEPNFTRKMRKELPESETEKIIEIIEKLADQRLQGLNRKEKRLIPHREMKTM